MRTTRKTVAALAAAALVGTLGAGAAQASAPSAAPAPSACRPANHTATIKADHPSAGHQHYRVTLSTPKGYASCTLSGSPTGVAFFAHGKRIDVTAGHYGDQRAKAVLRPGHPVHFDIQVPDLGRTTRADGASFTLRTPGGTVPGQSSVDGGFAVARGTLVGPVQPGA
ncbi:DUF4232 domain-containing protein [Streptomyces sp. NPDC001941]|uniref:DUF4232 domain-containing protein n=1 Tax=Streptomyces sp. NPDC001941 TaxID=3154659 RepID=UPI003317CC5B